MKSILNLLKEEDTFGEYLIKEVNLMKTRTLEIFGKKYKVFSQSCCSTTEKRTLYVDLLNICNAKCGFCSSSCNVRKSIQVLDINYAKDVILELIKTGAIDKISLTGGEPLLYPHLKELLAFLDDMMNYGLMFYAITTNGILLPKYIKLLENSKVKYINISRHHYQQNKNDEVFGMKTCDESTLREIVLKSRKRFRFNVTITENLCTRQDIMEYIQFAKKVGIKSILLRKEYLQGKCTEEVDSMFKKYETCKQSTKCECRIKNIDGVTVEYRKVNVKKEMDVEIKGKYIRNFVLKNNNRLMSGWSDHAQIL